MRREESEAINVNETKCAANACRLENGRLSGDVCESEKQKMGIDRENRQQLPKRMKMKHIYLNNKQSVECISYKKQWAAARVAQ